MFHKLMHKHGVEAPAAQAVRNRRGLVAELIDSIAREQPSWQPLRIMSVACGSAAEMMDIFKHQSDADRFELTFFDQDTQALTEAKQSIEDVQARLERPIKTDFINASVRTMLRTPQVVSSKGKFHLIYSMGLFDYLTPPVAKAVAEKMYQMLSPGGIMFIGNFHVANSDRYYLEYWMDWVLYYRTEEELLDIVAGLRVAAKTVQFEPTGTQMFLKVRKPDLVVRKPE